jgi:hypothetical protein
MLHDMEHMSTFQLAQIGGADTIFGVAASDPSLNAAGMNDTSALKGIQHFNLCLDEVHWLACDCHGELTNYQMAERIAEIGHRSR